MHLRSGTHVPPAAHDLSAAWLEAVTARLRLIAYQKNVVMKYLDNLIAWGDTLFGRDTIESINEAALLYLLAYEILGDRPQKVPHRDGPFAAADEPAHVPHERQ